MKTFFRYPWMILVAVLGITFFLGWQIPDMRMDNSLRSFLMEDHPAKIKAKKLEAIYGNNDVIMIIMRAEGASIFSLPALAKVEAVTRALEKTEYVQEVTSLATVDYMAGMEGGISAEKIMPRPPRNQEELRRLKEKLASWDIYRGFLYSDDMQATQIVVKLVTEVPEEKTTVTPEGKAVKTMRMVPTHGDEEKQAFLNIQRTLKEYEDEETRFYVVGNEAVSMLVTQGIREDMLRLVPFVFIALLIILYIAFRNISGVWLTTVTVICSCVWTLGLMALLHVPFTVMSSAIPVLLVAVGSAYGIHLISHYYDELSAAKREKDAVSSRRSQELVFVTFRKIGMPIFLAGITTMAGFGSLASSSILMVRNFGIFTAIGVAVALLVTLTLIPALLLIQRQPLRPLAGKPGEQDETLTTQTLAGVYHFFTKRTNRVLTLAIVVVLLAIIGIRKIIIGEEVVNYFRPQTEVRQADAYTNRHFNGSTIMYLHLQGREQAVSEAAVSAGGKKQEQAVAEDDFAVPDALPAPGEESGQDQEPDSRDNKRLKGMKEPDILQAMDDLKTYLTRKYPEVKQVLSFADMIKRMNKVMHTDMPAHAPAGALTAKDLGGILERSLSRTDQQQFSGRALVEAVLKEINYQGEAFDEIPTDPAKYGKTGPEDLRRLISQYLLLYSGNLNEFIDNMDHPTSAKMTVQMNDGHPQFIKRIKTDIIKYAQKHIEPLGYTLETVGMAEMVLAVNDYIIKTQISSILLSLLFVFIVLTVYLRSWLSGMLGIVPLSISLLINFGIMGFFNIPLEIGTALVASVSIGIGIDYSIHFISGYYREKAQTADLETATQRTLVTTGKAILFNAVSVAVGFAILLFSAFSPLRFLGILVSMTMLTSSFASMTILPVLLNLFKPRGRLAQERIQV
ncbi:RND family transporter [candidate division FCPU426 bacterium]|nr:RND family transporter [candidate division FCPU426 bacterium]